jgi:molybdopterin synthase sulfur carrier subunit
MIQIVLPAHLRTLAGIASDVELDVQGPVTQRSVLDALEARYPMLQGTLRDHVTQERRPFVRFFACAEDVSHEQPDAPLPAAVATGKEPFVVIGAIAGGSGPSKKEPFVYFGVLVWLGLCLRDNRLRSLIPLTQPKE